MRYVELHARSAFTFLDGASLPEALAYTCAELQIPGMALLDRSGVYGSPRFQIAAKQQQINAHVGAEVHIAGNGFLPLLAAELTGYQNLCRLITTAKLRTQKPKLASARMDELEGHSSGLICLTGDEDGPLANALQRGGASAGRELLNQLTRAFGHENVYVELQRHHDRYQESRNEQAVTLAKELRLPILATNGVRYAIPRDREIADVFTCIKNSCQLDTAGRLLSRNSERYIRTPKEMTELFSDLPDAISNTCELSSRLQFTLERKTLGYEFPRYLVPDGETMDSFLRKRTWEGARCRFRPVSSRVRTQIEKELSIIEQLGLAGYFLIVWDIICFCEQNGILVQGRGSAANSAVCYSLGITAVDPMDLNLLFERFLSLERGEWPDIDLDLPSRDEREKVIQYVYKMYGQRGAAMTANVNTYRGRSSVSDAGKSLGIDEDTRKRLSKITDRWEWRDPSDTRERQFHDAGLDIRERAYARFLNLSQRIQNLPRHLSQHSGGMVICQGQLDSVVPLEPATMEGRVVLQWDKDDCADLGLVKVDLLGLGMMAALKDSVILVQKHYNEEIDLAHLPSDKDCKDIYDSFCDADTVGVFQIESRAQMASLPRNKPREFNDLIAQVALIRPGPITGNMTNPYLKRRQGLEPVTYEHPILIPILKSTYGVPIYQEQMLEIARDCCGLTPGQAEELRRSMSHKRSVERMQAMEQTLLDGMARNKIPPANSRRILEQILSFASFGFPKSHSASFSLLVKASGFFKVRYVAAFTAALLNNQPMGFYHPATLIQDAKRHGLEVTPIDVTRSQWECSIERDDNGQLTVRLGLSYINGLPQAPAEELVRQRNIAPFSSVADLAHRVPQLNREHLTTLALSGALNELGDGETFHRRDALWQVEQAVHIAGPLFDALNEPDNESPLMRMTPEERLIADFNGTGVTVGPHAMAYLRDSIQGSGAITAQQLKNMPDGKWVTVAGHAMVKQRPGSAKGFLFMSLEDETGIGNIIGTPQFYEKHREKVARSPFVLMSGVVQNQLGIVHLKAHTIEAMNVTGLQLSVRSFH